MASSNTNNLFKYIPINELSNVIEEEQKISSGYYIDINKQLQILKESYNVNIYEQNPFYAVEHSTTEYLEYLKAQNSTQTENITEIADQLENVFDNMSPEDINALENIVENSLKQIDEPEKSETIDEMSQVDSDTDLSSSHYPNHNYLELGAAKTLIQMQKK